MATTVARTELARRLAALREEHEPPLSQQEAAAAIGVSLRQYGRLERGQADASLATIRKIASAYGVKPQLLVRDGSEQRSATDASALDDIARLEAKIDALLDYFDLGAGDALVTRTRSRTSAHRPAARRPS